jgi:hypothetical protein
MFAASAECLLNNLFSRICLLRFFKHNELKCQKLIFFKWHPVFIIALVESFFDKLLNKVAKFGAIFPLKRQYKNLVGLTKDNHTIWSLHKDESTNKTVFNN